IALCADHSLCQVIKGALQNKVKIMTKSSSIDLVTETDHKVEKIIILSVKEKFPTHQESVAAGVAFVYTNNRKWIINPVDGTTNFAHCGVHWLCCQ
uniref:Inositol monophosphatase n=1 Tax=Oncorhynchus tshawytscha TaxID=74940 RepID=A0A8C8GYZ7_ONCTS